MRGIRPVPSDSRAAPTPAQARVPAPALTPAPTPALTPVPVLRQADRVEPELPVRENSIQGSIRGSIEEFEHLSPLAEFAMKYFR